MRWEYRVVSKTFGDDLQSELNGYGEQGWEVVSLAGMNGTMTLTGNKFTALLKRARMQDDAALSEALDRRTCPWCREPIHPEAVVCRYCGRDVAPLPSIYLASELPIGHLEELEAQYGATDLITVLSAIESSDTAGVAVDSALVCAVFEHADGRPAEALVADEVAARRAAIARAARIGDIARSLGVGYTYWVQDPDDPDLERWFERGHFTDRTRPRKKSRRERQAQPPDPPDQP